MKKSLYFAAMAALAFTACTSDDDVTSAVEQNNAANAVVFGAYNGRNTRATKDVVGNVLTLAKKGGFGVYAFEQGTIAWDTYRASNTYPNFFYNQQVFGYSGSDKITETSTATSVDSWQYAPIKYFSNNTGAFHSFFAYAPYNPTVNAVFNNDGPAIRYSATTDTYDLLFADAITNKKKPSVSEKLMFNFHHALSKVSFNVSSFVDAVHGTDHDASGVDEKTTVVLRSVKFVGNVPSQGLLNLTDGTWKIEKSEESAYEFCPAEGVTLTSTAFENLPVSSDNMVIPNNTNTKVQIRVVYDVITKDAENPQNSSTITNTVTSVEDFPLAIGVSYMFNMDLGMTSVKFDATVENWPDDTETDVDLPNNTEDTPGTPAPTR